MDRAMAIFLVDCRRAPVLASRTETSQQVADGFGGYGQFAAHLLPFSHQAAAVEPARSSIAAAAATGNTWHSSGSSKASGPKDISHSRASSQVSHDPDGVVSSSTGSKPPPVSSCSARRRCSCRNRTTRVTAGRRRPGTAPTGCRLRPGRLRPRPADPERRTANATGSCSTSRGTGRAGSPRTAPRRRRHARDPSVDVIGDLLAGGVPAAWSPRRRGRAARVPTCSAASAATVSWSSRTHPVFG